MKHTLFIFAILTASIQTFAQSPRIKLNQITKDSVTGSVLISSPTDSGMVYSRDLFISYGADTVLILGGDTLAVTSGIISSVLSDGVTIIGNGTTGSELTADTSVLATLRALSDSLALVISSVTADGVTITGDGTVGSPLKVDTTTYIATKQDLDLYYLDSNPDGYTSNTGTVTSVAATAGTGISVSGSPITTSGTLTITNTAPDQTVSIAGGGINAVSGTYPSFTVTGTEVDGSVTNEIQTLSYNSSTNEITLSDGGGTEDLSNLDLVDSTRINATGDTAYYYQNGVLIGTGAIAGGGTTYNNISETADTVYISDYLDVDNSTLYVDAANNRVGIGTSSPSLTLQVNGQIVAGNVHPTDYDNVTTNPGFHIGVVDATAASRAMNLVHYGGTIPSASALLRLRRSRGTSVGDYTKVENNDALGYFEFMLSNGTGWSDGVGLYAYVDGVTGSNDFPTRLEFLTVPDGSAAGTLKMVIKNNGNVGIGTGSPSEKLDVDGNGRFRSIGSGASAGALHYTSTGVLTTNTSDIRLKTNLQLLDNTLDKLLNINTYTFNWIDETDRVDLGMIAQEVEQVFPNLVFTNPVDGYKGIHYDKFSSILTKAIQEQQTIIETIQSELTDKSSIIETQQTEIDQLKKLIQSLTTRIENLENN